MSINKPVGRRAMLAGGLGIAGLLAVPTSATADLSAQATFNSVADWGARAPNGTVPVINSPANKIIVHHTVYPNSTDYSVAQAYAHARAVQNLHIASNGWVDTGYNFIISRGGHATEGRTGGLDRLHAGTSFVQGAHTVGQNSQAIGIALEGTYSDGAAVPNDQWGALAVVCIYVANQYGIPSSQIFGHQDYSSTACPGASVQSRLPDLRAAVENGR